MYVDVLKNPEETFLRIYPDPGRLGGRASAQVLRHKLEETGLTFAESESGVITVQLKSMQEHFAEIEKGKNRT